MSDDGDGEYGRLGLPQPPLFKSGDYLVRVQSVQVAVNAQVAEWMNQFVVVHKPTGVVAGKSAQLPDAIRGCIALDREQRIVDADPYGEVGEPDSVQ